MDITDKQISNSGGLIQGTMESRLIKNSTAVPTVPSKSPLTPSKRRRDRNTPRVDGHPTKNVECTR